MSDVSTTRRRAIAGAAFVLASAGATRAGELGRSPLATPAAAEEELRRLLDAQARAWTSGDLEGFCGHYADDALFMSPSGLTKGRQAVYDRYKKKYLDKGLMGALSFDVLGVAASSLDEGAVASVAMRWKLAYKDKPEAAGFSVVALVRRGGRFLVVHDASM